MRNTLDSILDNSTKMLKIFVKIQFFVVFVVALILFGVVFDLFAAYSYFLAFLMGSLSAVLGWFVLICPALFLYAFAELVENTKANNVLLSSINKGTFLIAMHCCSEKLKTELEKTDKNEGK